MVLNLQTPKFPKGMMRLGWNKNNNNNNKSGDDNNNSKRQSKRNNKNKNNKKRVSFCTLLAEYHDIPTRENMRPADRQAMWYSDKERNIREGNIQVDVLLLTWSGSSDTTSATAYKTDQVSPRGLELKMSHTMDERKKNQKRAVRSVLNEQARQRNKGGSSSSSSNSSVSSSHRSRSNTTKLLDFERISTLYKQATQHCQDKAYKMGLGDQDVAAQIRCEDELCSNKNTSNDPYDETMACLSMMLFSRPITSSITSGTATTTTSSTKEEPASPSSSSSSSSSASDNSMVVKTMPQTDCMMISLASIVTAAPELTCGTTDGPIVATQA